MPNCKITVICCCEIDAVGNGDDDDAFLSLTNENDPGRGKQNLFMKQKKKTKKKCCSCSCCCCCCCCYSTIVYIMNNILVGEDISWKKLIFNGRTSGQKSRGEKYWRAILNQTNSLFFLPTYTSRNFFFLLKTTILYYYYYHYNLGARGSFLDPTIYISFLSVIVV
jgi:hypothetical protein